MYLSPDLYSMKVIDAKTPQAAIGIEGEDARIDSRYVASLLRSESYGHLYNSLRRLLKDERVKTDSSRSLFHQDTSDRLG